MPYRRSFLAFVPLLPVLAGFLLGVLRFRADDSLGGLASILGGMFLMIVVAIRIDPRE